MKSKQWLLIALVALTSSCGGKSTLEVPLISDGAGEDHLDAGGADTSTGGDGSQDGDALFPPHKCELAQIVPDQVAAMSLLVNQSSLYWTTRSAIHSASLDGSHHRVIVSGLNQPFGLKVDSSHMYWTSQAPGGVYEASKDGSSVTSLAPKSTTGAFANVEIDNSFVYYRYSSQNLSRVAKHGSGLRQSIMDDDTYSVGAFILSGQYLYYVGYNWGRGGIWRVGKDGQNAPQQLVASESARAGAHSGNALGLAVAAGRIYWVSNDAAQIMSARTDGSDLQVEASGLNMPEDVAADGQMVYWTEYNAVGEAVQGGGPRVSIAAGEPWLGPMSITEHGEYVYFTNAFGSSGSIARVCKKSVME